jgi:signal transduction histidine kinase
MKKNSGIRQRWLVNNVSILVLIVVAIVAVAVLAISGFYYSMMRSGLEAKLSATSDFFENYVSTSQEAFYTSIYQFTQDFDDKDSIMVEFLSQDGEVLASSFGLAAGTRPDTDDVRGALAGSVTSYTGKNPSTGERIMAVSGPLSLGGEQVGVLRYVTSLRVADRQIIILVAAAALLALVIILLIFSTGMYFIHSIVTPVAEITETTQRIAAGGYGVQIQKKFADSEDEIGELARAINNLSLQVSQTEKMQSEFLSSVSHELRTPLTAINGWGETILEDPTGDPVQLRRGIRIILNESRRLSTMVEELLEFSKMEDGRFTLRIEQVDLQAEFEDAIFTYRELFRQEGITLEYESSETEMPFISGDPERLKQVFCNVLDNAAKHGGAGGRITASVTLEDTCQVVRIRDYGPGIPEAELPFVKQKFYKGSSKARGSGIGLAVCDEIIGLHGGTFTIGNAEGGGAVVTIRLPCKEQ